MANPKKGKSRSGMNQAYAEEFREAIGGVAGEKLVQVLPLTWIALLVGIMPEGLLFNSDARVRFTGLVVPLIQQLAGVDATTRNAIQEFLVQSVEEIGKRSSELDPNDMEKSRKVMREAFAKKRGLLQSIKEQGDKMQKKTAPDYFTAKAAIEEDKYRDLLTRVEAEFKRTDVEMFGSFMRSGAFRIQTTPQELIDIAKASESDLGYGVERLKSLMKGTRGEGGVKAKVRNFAEDLLDETLQGGGVDEAAERLSERLDEAIDRSRTRRTRLKRGI